jgi:hypothetical protein
MIRSLIIGNKSDVEKYRALIGRSKFFGQLQTLVFEGELVSGFDLTAYPTDAYFLVSPLINVTSLLEQAIRQKKNLYFVDQPSLSRSEYNQLDRLFQESGNIMFPVVFELEHPLIEDFMKTSGSYLMFRYNRSVQGTRQVRKSLLTALCFLSILSPMQIKKIDINNIEALGDVKPMIKIRLKMYDSSLAYIILKFEHQEHCSMTLEMQQGIFTFNFSQNYLENIHGIRFSTEPVSTDDLIFKSLESFGFHIIMNTRPQYSFHHYCLMFQPLEKMLGFLQSNS